jgi:hypothetical protein
MAVHRTPGQALAVFECPHALSTAPWDIYVEQMLQALLDQLRLEQDMPSSTPTARSEAAAPSPKAEGPLRGLSARACHRGGSAE